MAAAIAARMSASTLLPAEAKMMAPMTNTGTSMRIATRSPWASATRPMKKMGTMPGMTKVTMREPPMPRARGGTTSEISALEAGTRMAPAKPARMVNAMASGRMGATASTP